MGDVFSPPPPWASMDARLRSSWAARYPPSWRRAHLECMRLARRMPRAGALPSLPALPEAMWHGVLSFAPRDWFARAPTALERVTARLRAEREARRIAEVRAEKFERELEQVGGERGNVPSPPAECSL